MRAMTDAEKENAAFEDGILFEQRRTREVLLKFITLLTTKLHSVFDVEGKENTTHTCISCDAEKVIKEYKEFKNDKNI